MAKTTNDNYSIFMGNSGACIAKVLKDGKPGKNRKMLTENEMANFVAWYLDYQFHKTKTESFMISKGEQEMFLVTDVIAQKMRKEKEAQDAGISA